MTQKTPDFNSFAEAQTRAFAPMVRLNELMAHTIERGARHAYGVAGDLLEAGVAQLNAAANARDVTKLVSQQTEIATKFFESQSKRYREWLDIASETQENLAKWTDAAAEDAKKTARKVA
jgi:phasin family protein